LNVSKNESLRGKERKKERLVGVVEPLATQLAIHDFPPGIQSSMRCLVNCKCWEFSVGNWGLLGDSRYFHGVLRVWYRWGLQV
jgi:hypothetical protein